MQPYPGYGRGHSRLRYLEFLHGTLQFFRRHLHIIFHRIQHRSLLHYQIRHVPEQVRQLRNRLRDLGDFGIPAADSGLVGMTLSLGLCQVRM